MHRDQPRWEDRSLTRRDLLCRGGMGMGALALAGVMGDAVGESNTLGKRPRLASGARSNHTLPPRPNA